MWIREIPSRYANVTHGGPAADPAAVMALRRKTAAQLAAKADWSGTNASSVIRSLEVLAYDNDAKYKAKAKAACDAFRSRIAAATAKPLASAPFFGELQRIKATTDAFVRNGVLSAKDSFVTWVNGATTMAEWEKAGMLRMVRSSKDGSEQPCWFWAPEKAKTEAVPLIVAFHTWSYDYRQISNFTTSLEQAKKAGWAMVGPNARGPNWLPQACGSDLVVSDVLDAVEYAKAHAKIDASRIYAIGGSGGGHLTLLMAGRAPEVFAGAAAFCPISDIAQWWRERGDNGKRVEGYALHIAKACGGSPAEKPEEYSRRSPLTWLARAREAGVPVYIATGIHDGHTGSVPVGHAIRAFNALADEKDRVSDADIDFIEKNQKVPASLAFKGTDPFYSEAKRIHMRCTSANARLTLFEGGHSGNFPAGFDFLSRQAKGKATDFALPDAAKAAELKEIEK